MKLIQFIFTLLLLIISCNTHAQDTFSIVALDSITGEVGSAGASCVDLTLFPGFSTDFLGELFPGEGAINTQASYIEANQINARNRFLLGESPAQIISWLANNDVQSQPGSRQYGITRLVAGRPEAAAYTGVSTLDVKGHLTGPNYSIQGNILSGTNILDSMESNFLNAQGDLACKLMAAMQGANVIGADSRCNSNGTSSLFAFLKVAQPSDSFGNPSFLVSVQTPNGAGIEPIDSLQSLFDAAIPFICDSIPNSITTGIKANATSIRPNPAEDRIYFKGHWSGYGEFEIRDTFGKMIQNGNLKDNQSINISHLPRGTYVLKLNTKEESITQIFIKK